MWVWQKPNYFDVISSGYTLDFWAFGLVLALSLLLCWGIKETKNVNNAITVVHVGAHSFTSCTLPVGIP
jgi:amino acid transporter